MSAHVEALTARVLLLGKENAELRVDNAGLRAKVGYRFVEFFGSTVARFVGGEGEASGAAFAAGVVKGWKPVASGTEWFGFGAGCQAG